MLSDGLRLCSVFPHEHEMRPSYVLSVAPEFLIHKTRCHSYALSPGMCQCTASIFRVVKPRNQHLLLAWLSLRPSRWQIVGKFLPDYTASHLSETCCWDRTVVSVSCRAIAVSVIQQYSSLIGSRVPQSSEAKREDLWVSVCQSGRDYTNLVPDKWILSKFRNSGTNVFHSLSGRRSDAREGKQFIMNLFWVGDRKARCCRNVERWCKCGERVNKTSLEAWQGTPSFQHNATSVTFHFYLLLFVQQWVTPAENPTGRRIICRKLPLLYAAFLSSTTCCRLIHGDRRLMPSPTNITHK
jgi:hypothetical protein